MNDAAGVRKEETRVLCSSGFDWVPSWRRPCWVCGLRDAGWRTNLVCSDKSGVVVGCILVQHCEECGRLSGEDMLQGLNDACK